MIVSEYIELLKTYPQDLDVYIHHGCCDDSYELAESPDLQPVEGKIMIIVN